jgi:4-carboxymuconolactone decarboxylase
MSTATPDRYARGRDKSPKSTARPANPSWTRSAISAATSSNTTFGDVYTRPGLSLRDRELATVAMLAAKGGHEAQLDVHLHAARNVDLTVDELREVLIQVAFYAGFPAAINAMRRLQALEAKEAGSSRP